ncbi:MAG: LuxR C-terminal-related transcriptional regulator [Syntrophomonas sp.]
MVEIASKTGLIGTKYSKPEINQYLISRQRLHQKLDNSLNSKLTMIIAPAGYGKTTAVLDWLRKRGQASAWLSVDDYDNNPTLFWQYFCAALDGIAEGISKSTEYVFSSWELLKANIHISILIDRLSEVQSDFLLVVDDLHLITDLSILRGLSYLISYLPEKMHLIVISRTEPGLELAKHRIKWQVHLVSEKDLGFRNEEIFQFYQARGYILECDDVREIENYTEGWVAALVAIAMSMKEEAGSQDTLKTLAHASRDIEQYLRNEVLRIWPEEKRVFAMKTSILSTLSESLCDAITGDKNASRILKEIHEGGGFLIAIDAQNHEYRYHQLFKSFLYKLLLESDPDGLSILQHKAALWYREHGFISEAIEHLLDSRSYNEALDLIEPRVDEHIYKNDYMTLLTWIDRLPETCKDQNFKFALAYAAYYAEMNRFELSREWIGRMEVLAVDDKYASTAESTAYVKAACALTKANLQLRQGMGDELLQLINSAAGQCADIGITMTYFDFNTTDIYFLRCPVNHLSQLFSKDPDGFNQLIINYRTIITENPGYAPLAVGEYLYENNRLEEAMPYLLEALEEAQGAYCPGALVPAMINITRIKRAKGDIPSAFAILDECEKKLRSIGKPHWNYILNAFRCRLFIDAGDAAKILEWFGSYKYGVFMEINKTREFELMVYSRILMISGHLDDAKLLLQRLLGFTESAQRLHSMVEVLNLLAILAYKNGDMPGAVNYLEKSLSIGIKEGYVCSYIDEHAPMADLLRYYTTRRRKRTGRELTAYARNLLIQTQESLSNATALFREAPAAGMKKLLTAQEKNILELLFQANTNREISLKLGISLATVKTHTGNIYGKLGVRNRAECIKMTREARLLE